MNLIIFLQIFYFFFLFFSAPEEISSAPVEPNDDVNKSIETVSEQPSTNNDDKAANDESPENRESQIYETI